MMKIAVIQTAFPGDVILATPVFEALKDIHPRCYLTAVVKPASFDLLKDSPFIDEIIRYDKYGKDKGLGGLFKISRLLKGYDWAIIIQRYLRSALIAYLAGIKRRTGYKPSGFRFLYSESVPYNEDKHEVLRCLELIGADDPDRFRPRIIITDETREKTDAILLEHNIKGELAAMAPGSVWATKRYPCFDRLVDLVKEKFGIGTIILGGPDDMEISRSVADRARNKPCDLTGKTDLLVSADIISRSRILIANDSAPAHMAAAVGTPVIAIFGPTVPAFGFSPYSDKARVIDIGKLYCRPCSRHGSKKCPQGHFKCMLELNPEKIIEAAGPLIF